MTMLKLKELFGSHGMLFQRGKIDKRQDITHQPINSRYIITVKSVIMLLTTTQLVSGFDKN